MCFFIGLMSGTSADAIDAALVSFKNQTINLEHYKEFSYPALIKERIVEMRSSDAELTFKKLADLDISLGQVFADAVEELLTSAKINRNKITAIGSHGQTIFHSPNSTRPFSLQLGNPNTIAYKTRITTIADFRNMDIAAGGQGAPLAPGFHAELFRQKSKTRIVLNLGGIANITLLPSSPDQAVTGFDTGPANALMDEWILQNLGETYDRDGRWGESGNVIPDLLMTMLEDDYFHAPSPKSTGREYFNLDWLSKKTGDNTFSPEDIQATLQHLTVQSVARSIESIDTNVSEVILCGGGVHNKQIVKLLSEALPGVTINSTATYGVDPGCIEAMAFAWLAKRRLDNLPGNIPSVTGARKEVLLGAIYG